MRIGIDGSRAFLKQRTGIEEYSYQVIKNLQDKFKGHQVMLYLRPGQSVDFALPENWKIKRISPSFFWTQIGLSWELFLHPIDALFIPGHTVPLLHPKNTVVTVHGLEYELMPEAYSSWERFYMRFSIKNSCRWARKIVSVSRNTRQDLMMLYDIPEEKINVVYEGYEKKASKKTTDEKVEYEPYFLFIGRLERRKNIERIVESFTLFKERYQTEHKLVLGGKFGYGGEDIQLCIDHSKFKRDIIILGFVKEETKWRLFRRATVFLFPTLYEGFGLPVLEAQSRGIPVITSNVSSLPEITNGSAILVDPKEPEMICEALRSLTVAADGAQLRAELVAKGYENVKRFSWENCAGVIARILTEN